MDDPRQRGEERFREEGETAKKDREEGERKQKIGRQENQHEKGGFSFRSLTLFFLSPDLIGANDVMPCSSGQRSFPPKSKFTHRVLQRESFHSM